MAAAEANAGLRMTQPRRSGVAMAAVLLLAALSGQAVGARTSVDGGRVAWRPNPGPQTLALMVPDRGVEKIDEVVYGGARGGGKSVWLILDFVEHAASWGDAARGILFRRYYPDLTELWDIASRILTPLGWRPNRSPGMDGLKWVAPNGAVLFFRALRNAEDYGKYHGHSYTWVGLDELTQWPAPGPVDMLWSCMRSARGVSVVRRATCNPGGPGHGWVKDRYRLGSQAAWPLGKPVVWQPQPEAAPDVWIRSLFIPARTTDNPSIDPGDYRRRLAASAGSAQMLKAWWEGDWDAVEGAAFDLYDPDLHEFDEDEVDLRPWWFRWVAIDWGFEHEAGILYAAFDGETIFVEEEMTVRRMTPAALGEEVAKGAVFTDREGNEHPRRLNEVIASHDMFRHVSEPRRLVDQLDEVLVKWQFPHAISSGRDRVGNINLLRHLLSKPNGIKFNRRRCSRTIELVKNAQRANPAAGGNPEDIEKFDGDDLLDALLYLVKGGYRAVREPLEAALKKGITAKAEEDPTAFYQQAAAVEQAYRRGGNTVRTGPAWARQRRRGRR